MNVKAYTYLLAIEENRSLTKAAMQLGISQPALSKFLANTELSLGHHLFMKSQNSLIPTDAGRIYLDACREIINIKQRTYASITKLTQVPERTIVVGVTPYRGTQFFSNIYSRILDKYPHIEIKAHEGYMTELKKGIDEGSIDLAIGTVTPTDERYYSFASIAYEQLCLAVPLSHPAAAQSDDSGKYFPVIDIQTLSDAPFVMWGESTTNARIIEEYMSRNHLVPTVVYRGNNALMVNEMLKTGIGVGFIPHSFCKPHEGRVYFSTWPPVQSFNGIYYKKDRELSEAERYFIYLMMHYSATSETNVGSNIYYNRISRAIISEFGNFNIDN